MKASRKVKAEIDSLLKRFSDAVSHRDEKGLLALFVPDRDIVMLGSEEGESAMNRTEFHKFLRRVLSREVTYSWKWKRKAISMRGQVAWIAAQGFVVAKGDVHAKSAPYRLTAIFERRKGKWLWTHYHGSEPV